MSLSNKFNNEDILSRAVIAGLLNVLNNTIEYEQKWSNHDIEKVNVPWFYNQSGDERFMQDFYTHYADCEFPKPVDGNMDMIPRGVITYTGSIIDSQRITNRFVQGKYVKEVNGQLESFVSFLYSIPLTIMFDCELWVDTQISAMKIEQAIREYFYKTITYYVYYKGLRVGCTSGFSEDITIDKKIAHSFEPDKQIKMTFTIEVETYQPVFDPTTEMNANNNIKSFGYRMYSNDEKNDGRIRISSPSSELIWPKSFPLPIEWDYDSEGAIINKVDAFWLNHGENEWFEISKGIPNHQFYNWVIPPDFTKYKDPTLIWDEDGSTNIYREPILSIIPDVVSKEINETSFSVFDPGYFLSNADTSIGLILEMKDDQNKITYTKENDIFINIKDNIVDITNPVWIDPSANIIFPGTVDFKLIDIHIANTVNNDVFGVTQKIKIV